MARKFLTAIQIPQGAGAGKVLTSDANGVGSWQTPTGGGGPRIVYGVVNSTGTIARGTGFTVTRNGAGDYTVTFSTAFAAAPVVTALVGLTAGALAIKEHPSSVASTTAIRLLVFTTTTGAATDANFHFHAVGA